MRNGYVLVVSILDGPRFWTRDIDACGATSTADALARARACGSLVIGDTALLFPMATVAGAYLWCHLWLDTLVDVRLGC